MAKTVELGGDRFEILAMASAWETFALQPLFGPGVMELFGVFEQLPRLLGNLAMENGAEGLAALDAAGVISALAPIIGRALGKIPPEDLKAIMRGLFEPVTVWRDGKPAKLNDVFGLFMRGRTMDTWKLLFYALKENYPDFFALLPASASGSKEPSRTEASSTSNSSAPATA